MAACSWYTLRHRHEHLVQRWDIVLREHVILVGRFEHTRGPTLSPFSADTSYDIGPIVWYYDTILVLTLTAVTISTTTVLLTIDY